MPDWKEQYMQTLTKQFCGFWSEEAKKRNTSIGNMIKELGIPSKHMAFLATMETWRVISRTNAKRIAKQMCEEPQIDPCDVAIKQDLIQVHSPTIIHQWLQEAINENPKAYDDCFNDKKRKKATQFLKGFVMRKSNFTANDDVLDWLIKEIGTGQISPQNELEQY